MPSLYYCTSSIYIKCLLNASRETLNFRLRSMILWPVDTIVDSYVSNRALIYVLITARRQTAWLNEPIHKCDSHLLIISVWMQITFSLSPQYELYTTFARTRKVVKSVVAWILQRRLWSREVKIKIFNNCPPRIIPQAYSLRHFKLYYRSST